MTVDSSPDAAVGAVEGGKTDGGNTDGGIEDLDAWDGGTTSDATVEPEGSMGDATGIGDDGPVSNPDASTEGEAGVTTDAGPDGTEESAVAEGGIADDGPEGGWTEDGGAALTVSPGRVLEQGALYFGSYCASNPNEITSTPITDPTNVTVTNASDASVSFTASVGTSYFGVFLAGPPSASQSFGATVGAEQSVTFQVATVTLRGYPPAQVVSDTLTIQSSAQTLTIPLSESFEGLWLPTFSVDFGDVAVGTTASQTVDLVYTGSPEEFGASGANTSLPFRLQINPEDIAANLQPWVVSFSPSATGPASGSATFENGGVTYCTPNQIALSGTGD